MLMGSVWPLSVAVVPVGAAVPSASGAASVDVPAPVSGAGFGSVPVAGAVSASGVGARGVAGFAAGTGGAGVASAPEALTAICCSCAPIPPRLELAPSMASAEEFNEFTRVL